MVRTTASGKSDLEFHYDAMGNRVCKIVKPRTAGVGIQSQDNWTYTYYMRDATGNVIAVYDRDYTTPALGIFKDRYSLKENHLYGSSRTGIRSVSEFQMAVTYNYSSTAANGVLIGTFASRSSTAAPTTSFLHVVGAKSYELSNHLGNVLVTVSDARTATNSSGTISAFNAIVVSAQDYYAFGSAMVGRTVSGSYRYSFNGKETDAETELQDYGMRIYNPELGRFLSMDPLVESYPMLSPYQFAGNTPFWAIDLDGLEPQPGTTPNMSESTNTTDQGTPVVTPPPIMIQLEWETTLEIAVANDLYVKIGGDAFIAQCAGGSGYSEAAMKEYAMGECA